MRHGADAGDGGGVAAGGSSTTPDAGLTIEPAVRSARVRIGVGAGVVIAIVALVAAVVFNAFGQRGSATELVAPSATPGVPDVSGVSGVSGASGSSAGGAGTELLVHVLGAVKRPGLVSLASGSRVVDAVASAGGLTDEADVAGINLARPVADGEQLVVPKIGEVSPAAAAGAAGAGVAGTGGAAGAGGAVVNLNTATQADLETLPRIGPALAQRILDWRTANGRFTGPADLMKVTGIGQKLFDGLSDRITV